MPTHPELITKMVRRNEPSDKDYGAIRDFLRNFEIREANPIFGFAALVPVYRT